MNATNKKDIIKRLNKESDTEILALIVFLIRQRGITPPEIEIAGKLIGELEP